MTAEAQKWDELVRNLMKLSKGDGTIFGFAVVAVDALAAITTLRAALAEAERERDAANNLLAAHQIRPRGKSTLPEILEFQSALAAAQGDAARGRYLVQHAIWERYHGDDAHTRMALRLPVGVDLSCEAMREIAIDSAIAAAAPSSAPPRK